MGGVLVGCFICGHLGDMIGRKPTYFSSLVILVVFNVAAYFCPNWQLYAAIRFVLGAGMDNVFTNFHVSALFSFSVFFSSFSVYEQITKT